MSSTVVCGAAELLVAATAPLQLAENCVVAENSEMTTTCTLGTDGAELIMLLAD